MASKEAKEYLKHLMSGKSILSTMNPCDEAMNAFDAGVESGKKKHKWHDLPKEPCECWCYDEKLNEYAESEMTDEEKINEYLDKKYLPDMGVRRLLRKAFFTGLQKAERESVK